MWPLQPRKPTGRSTVVVSEIVRRAVTVPGHQPQATSLRFAARRGIGHQVGLRAPANRRSAEHQQTGTSKQVIRSAQSGFKLGSDQLLAGARSVMAPRQFTAACSVQGRPRPWHRDALRPWP